MIKLFLKCLAMVAAILMVNNIAAQTGRFEVAIKWSNKKLDQAKITSLNGGILKLRTAAPIKIN